MKTAAFRPSYPSAPLLNRPIAFHRCFVTLTGSVTAALMLSQALYWQRRTQHAGGWWFKIRDEWTSETGMSRREQETARRRLRQLGLLHEELRGIPAQLWYRVDEARLLELLEKPIRTSFSDGVNPPRPLRGDTSARWAETYSQEGRKRTCKKGGNAPAFKGTEISTETTTTTTPYPSSTNTRAAEAGNAAVSSCGGAKDEKTLDQDGSNHGDRQQTPDEEKTVFKKETERMVTTGKDSNTPLEDAKTVDPCAWIESQPPELIYPTKLTAQEQEDITQQICGLPAETAQQMLDVVESQIRGNQIRTNPAAVLRGILRRYRTGPHHFDPSSGFQIAAQRRRQAEIEAHQRQAEERRVKQLTEAAEATAAARAARPAPRAPSEGQRRFVEVTMHILRGASPP